MALPVWLLVLLIAPTIAVPLLYVVITWEHEVVGRYPVLPAPTDLGTKEFRWRCYLSSLTRRGWRNRIARLPCPRVTLQCPFALLSTDFAKLTTSLGFQELRLETIPFIFPQIATSGLMLQLLGNSHFPAALNGLRLKSIKICQLRPLDMRFRDKVVDKNEYKDNDSSAEDDNASSIHCVMVLTEKRFVRDEVEFAIQTDLFDDQGTVWQSTTCIAVPFVQSTLAVPRTTTMAELDADLATRNYSDVERHEFSCSERNLSEFEAVNVTNLDGTASRADAAPLLWMLGRLTAVLQQQQRVPALPLLCGFVLHDEQVIGLHRRVTCESSVSEGGNGKDIIKAVVTHDGSAVIEGQLRTVGWVFEPGSNPAEPQSE
ncbi:hypothetical protein PINS_up009445 [Pythium insidiosum]|nr:hypothetical protein PINS_up009445 [Pythium insidiosum]